MIMQRASAPGWRTRKTATACSPQSPLQKRRGVLGKDTHVKRAQAEERGLQTRVKQGGATSSRGSRPILASYLVYKVGSEREVSVVAQSRHIQKSCVSVLLLVADQ